MQTDSLPRGNSVGYRKLRIAWSVVCGVAAVLLIVLWIRSYSHSDLLRKASTSEGALLNSWKGRLTFWSWKNDTSSWLNPQVRPEPVAENLDNLIRSGAPIAGFWRFLGFGRVYPLGSTIVFAPYWFPVLFLAAIASVVWYPWQRRFSLRTLLIATTLVAVMLGLIVWLR
jgi:hypothetical protein